MVRAAARFAGRQFGVQHAGWVGVRVVEHAGQVLQAQDVSDLGVDLGHAHLDPT
jgi:hypothetical protein